MLSHQTSKPTTTDDRRQLQQHRRQQSTPTVYEAQASPIYPATQQFTGQHRRGMSMNQPVAQFRQQHQQDTQLVGITNPGQTQQHYLQEAQQHSQARPGLQHQHQQQHHQQQQTNQHTHSLPQLSEEEFRKLQHQQLDAQIDSLFHINNPHSFNNDQHVVKIERSRSHPEAYHGMAVVTPPLRSANGSPIQSHLDPQSASKGADGARDMTSLRQNLAPRPARPFTPPDQSSNGLHPLTPGTSPRVALVPVGVQSQDMKRTGSQEDVAMATIRPGRSPVKQVPQSSHALVELGQSSGQIDRNATIKARNREAALQRMGALDLFQPSRMDISTESLPSPPHTSPLRGPAHLDVAFMPTEQHLQLTLSPSDSEAYFDSVQSLQGSSHTSPQRSPTQGSFQQIRDHYRGDVAVMVPLQSGGSSPSHTARSSIDFELFESPTREDMSPRAMSMEDLNLDATIEDTGISAEEVQSYISQPDPETGKWTCMYPECGKMFGRKENVRAHVQTHLGDRQFKCIHCGKCFVRQHDLKRHSKTHSGVKPYPCRCGNSFARHDALTRHRQRGICTGGFEGVVKKVAKRGRPRKERPSRDDRIDKAARTRKRAVAKSYASSVSGTSESSYPESPQFLLEGLDFETRKAAALQSFNAQSFTLDPEMLNISNPTSPYSHDESPSPRKAQSTTSGHTPKSNSLDDDQTAAIFEGMNVRDTIQNAEGSNLGSQAGSPPELSHSSPPSSTRFLDFDFGTNFNSSGSAPGDDTKQEHQATDFDSLSLHLAHSPDNNMFNSSWNENTFLSFDKDTSGSSAAIFNSSFDDDIMFSDNCEPGGGFF